MQAGFNPKDAFQRALGLHQQGQIGAAQHLYQQILAHDARHFDAAHLLGLALLQQGDFAGAAHQIGVAIAINNQYSGAYNNRGVALTELQNYQAAIADFNQALALKPTDPEAHYNKARAHFASGQGEEALVALDRAIQLRPAYPQAYLTRGLVQAEKGRLSDALASYDQALQLQPQWDTAHFNRGNVLADMGQAADAIAAFTKALQLSPGHADALNNRGNMLRGLKRYDEALADFTRAAALRPGFVGAEVNRAMAYLTLGDFARGWAAYEWRLRSPELSPLTKRFPQPRWTGAESLSGKTILLMAEQGLGDTLQFCRFAAQVAEKGGRVLLEVQPSLKSLLSTLPGISAVYADNEGLPPFDYYCPLLSLPLALGIELHTIPAAPYIVPDARKVEFWRNRVDAHSSTHARPRVGLVWAGSPRKNMPAAHAIDQKRSLHLKNFAPLAQVKNVQFFSLQKGEPASQLAELSATGWSGPALTDWTDDLHDFSDTAAFVANLDLVITCDTSVAHLAGGMGKSVWILNRYDGCWRWLTGRDDSPWYPTARLFHQTAPNEWPSVISNVCAALSAFESQAT